MIAMEVLHVDLHAQPMAEPARVAVFASKQDLLYRRQIEAGQTAATFESLVTQGCIRATSEHHAESVMHEQVLKARRE